MRKGDLATREADLARRTGDLMLAERSLLGDSP